jgi:Transketolase, N-terminal subunit
MDRKQLEKKAYELRKKVIEMIYHGGSGHPGGSLSAAEIISVLYFSVMNIDAENPKKENRDRFVLSKGHACPIVYAALCERGFFADDILCTLRQTNSILQGHPDCKKTPGLDATTGSLGQGLSIGFGMALGARQRRLDYNIFVLLSDGEMQEGMTWEAAMSSAHYKCGNITAIVDCNNLQVDGHIDEVMNIEPLADKWRAFGWDCVEVDGHDVQALSDAFNTMHKKDKPRVILCKTVKGKGVSFMEDVMEWHASPIDDDIYCRAIQELEEKIKSFT